MDFSEDLPVWKTNRTRLEEIKIKIECENAVIDYVRNIQISCFEKQRRGKLSKRTLDRMLENRKKKQKKMRWKNYQNKVTKGVGGNRTERQQVKIIFLKSRQHLYPLRRSVKHGQSDWCIFIRYQLSWRIQPRGNQNLSGYPSPSLLYYAFTRIQNSSSILNRVNKSIRITIQMIYNLCH